MRVAKGHQFGVLLPGQLDSAFIQGRVDPGAHLVALGHRICACRQRERLRPLHCRCLRQHAFQFGMEPGAKLWIRLVQLGHFLHLVRILQLLDQHGPTRFLQRKEGLVKDARQGASQCGDRLGRKGEIIGQRIPHQRSDRFDAVDPVPLPLHLVEHIHNKPRAQREVQLVRLIGIERFLHMIDLVHRRGVLVAVLHIDALPADTPLLKAEQRLPASGNPSRISDEVLDCRPVQVKIVIAFDKGRAPARRPNSDESPQGIKESLVPVDNDGHLAR